MGTQNTDGSFDNWVRYLFDHPVTDPAWHWDINAEFVDLEPNRVVQYTTQLLRHSSELLAPYSDAQANLGLWFLIGEGNSPLHVLTEPTIPIEDRLRCIDSISILFEQCFAKRCTPHLSHLDEPGAGALNPVCYMWWDVFPLYGQPENLSRHEIDARCLSVMETVLQLPSIACQESVTSWFRPLEHLLSASLPNHHSGVSR